MTTTVTTSATLANRNTVFASREQYLAFVAAFKAIAARRALTPEIMALHALALGKPLGRTFSPVTNTTKLANGCNRWLGAQQALGCLPYVTYRPDVAELVKHLPEGAFKTLTVEASRIRNEKLDSDYAARTK